MDVFWDVTHVAPAFTLQSHPVVTFTGNAGVARTLVRYIIKYALANIYS
jgi:20S proteasome alpha/beta subunit